MKIFTNTNQKGGVGKSTSNFHFAHYFAMMGYRVLLVDADVQGTSSACLGCKVLKSGGAADIFASENEIAPVTIQGKKGKVAYSFDFLPASVGALNLDLDIENAKTVAAVRQAFMRYQDRYDLVLIDPPGALESGLLLAALAVSDYVVTPTGLSGVDLAGFDALMGTIMRIKQKQNPKLVYAGVIPNKVMTGSPQQRAKLVEMREELGSLCFTHSLANRAAVSECTNPGSAVPIWSYGKTGAIRAAAKEWLAVCEEVARRIHLHTPLVKA